jgi:hypothetical protein
VHATGPTLTHLPELEPDEDDGPDSPRGSSSGQRSPPGATRPFGLAPPPSAPTTPPSRGDRPGPRTAPTTEGALHSIDAFCGQVRRVFGSVRRDSRAGWRRTWGLQCVMRAGGGG